MKKLTVSMAVVLTASILMSSTAFAAMLKPKSDTKSAPKSSSSTSEKADNKKSDTKKDETGTEAKSTAKTNVLLASNSSKTLTITAPKVASTVSEKIKIKDYNGKTKSVNSTIYEIAQNGTIMSKGTASCALMTAVYVYEPKSKVYVMLPEPTMDKLGTLTLSAGSNEILYQFNIMDGNDTSQYGIMLDTKYFVRVLTAK